MALLLLLAVFALSGKMGAPGPSGQVSTPRPRREFAWGEGGLGPP
jgi:hypothetical protein